MEPAAKVHGQLVCISYSYCIVVPSCSICPPGTNFPAALLISLLRTPLVMSVSFGWKYL